PRTHAWVTELARAFHALRAPGTPALVPGAPHAWCPHMASWSLQGLTESLGIYVFASRPREGARHGTLWLALDAPGGEPDAAHTLVRDRFAARGQTAWLDTLPETTRALLFGALPWRESPRSE